MKLAFSGVLIFFLFSVEVFASSFSKEDRVSSLKGYSFETKLNYLGDGFTNDDVISTQSINNLLADEILTPVKVNVTDIRGIKVAFDLDRNGFEFIDFRNNSKCAAFLRTLDDMALNPLKGSHREAMRRKTEHMLEDWGHVKGIEFQNVYCVDAVYRNTDPKVDNVFGAVPLVHVDFPQRYREILSAFIDPWKIKIEESLQSTLSEIDYLYTPIVKMVNVWMPLSETVEASPLVLLDLTSMQNWERETNQYTAVRKDGRTFKALGLYPQASHRWYWKSYMQRGEAVIFESTKTPHSAASFPDEEGKFRQSVETRCLFVKNASSTMIPPMVTQ